MGSSGGGGAAVSAEVAADFYDDNRDIVTGSGMSRTAGIGAVVLPIDPQTWTLGTNALGQLIFTCADHCAIFGAGNRGRVEGEVGERRNALAGVIRCGRCAERGRGVP